MNLISQYTLLSLPYHIHIYAYQTPSSTQVRSSMTCHIYIYIYIFSILPKCDVKSLIYSIKQKHIQTSSFPQYLSQTLDWIHNTFHINTTVVSIIIALTLSSSASLLSSFVYVACCIERNVYTVPFLLLLLSRFCQSSYRASIYWHNCWLLW